MYFPFDFGWYSIQFDIVRSEQELGGLLNRQNPIGVSIVPYIHSISYVNFSKLQMIQKISDWSVKACYQAKVLKN